MDNNLRESFSLILKKIFFKKFEDCNRDELIETGLSMMDLKKIAVNYCDCEPYEFLALLINASSDKAKVDVDEHIIYCKLLDMWEQSGLDINLL